MAKDFDAFGIELDDRIASARDLLTKDLRARGEGAEKAVAALTQFGRPDERGGFGRRGFGDVAGMIGRVVNVERSWFHSAMLDGVTGERFESVEAVHREALKKRAALVAKFSGGEDFDFRAIFEAGRDVVGDLDAAVESALGQKLYQDFERNGGGSPGFGRRSSGGRGGSTASKTLRPQGRSALIWIDPKTKTPRLFDFVNVTERKSGFKVRLHKDRPLDGMTTFNVLYESDERSILTESLAYQLYELAGNATPRSGYTRVLFDGEFVGYHLYSEQPNGNFFRRSALNDGGNLYKIIWMGSHRPSTRTPEELIPDRRDVVGRHEKVTNVHSGYRDIVEVVEALEGAENDAARWEIIRAQFDVDQVINYFAVNTLLSHWDGFFNNHFVYHDRKGTKKWTLYPWDQDSTWGHRMGRGDTVFAEMPLTFGMEGDIPPGQDRSPSARRRESGRRRGGFRGFGGGPGAMWWREGGEFSKPLLANPQFRARFLDRLKVLAETVYTEAVFEPRFERMERELTPEVRLRAETYGRSADGAVDQLGASLAFFREHLTKRRTFLLREIERELAAEGSRDS